MDISINISIIGMNITLLHKECLSIYLWYLINHFLLASIIIYDVIIIHAAKNRLLVCHWWSWNVYQPQPRSQNDAVCRVNHAVFLSYEYHTPFTQSTNIQITI